MMVGRDVQLQVEKKPANPGKAVLDVKNVTMHNSQSKKDSVKNVSFQVHGGEIVCLAGIEGNGQTEFIYGLTGLEKLSSGTITLDGKDITRDIHPPALQGRHEPYPRRPPQARSGAGLQPGEQHGAPALLAAGVPERRLHPKRESAGVLR